MANEFKSNLATTPVIVTVIHFIVTFFLIVAGTGFWIIVGMFVFVNLFWLWLFKALKPQPIFIKIDRDKDLFTIRFWSILNSKTISYKLSNISCTIERRIFARGDKLDVFVFYNLEEEIASILTGLSGWSDKMMTSIRATLDKAEDKVDPPASSGL